MKINKAVAAVLSSLAAALIPALANSSHVDIVNVALTAIAVGLGVYLAPKNAEA